VPTIFFDLWWHSKTMALKCHQGWTFVKTQDNTVRLGALHMAGGPILWSKLSRVI